MNEEAYRRELEYPIQYAHDDRLGLFAVSGAVGRLLGRGASVEPHSRLPDSGDVCWFAVP
ncbi:hypothetical protein Snoj_06650 [Streptomyces nojiriensis]|uniref:Uncharacterized protein n=1 Tax=Streptomyces nojiriensis TaxID=66374 RepID=A0ABQ3SF36_9ACTN|nr:hypothetical protein [Streptomyces nojiriensis]GGS02392.1 hypothetical protein GCM10010205_34010 [Streptomyces nojiriensis]GHI66747.1 hypothetical protein Snoj_06650 [Streptomyces nojiriensis]